MDEEESRLIYSFPRGRGEELQINLKKYNGKFYVDFRIWFKEKADAALYPTKKGISLGVDQIPELKKGIERLSKITEKPQPATEIHL